ncbi:MAG TPA: hypothetical protein VNC84_01110 [Gammaproteobacteria bacterium]|jgi:hypothetical protein|nr:hypothetical protein [Gammaproteobacteria bacterium]
MANKLNNNDKPETTAHLLAALARVVPANAIAQKVTNLPNGARHAALQQAANNIDKALQNPYKQNEELTRSAPDPDSNATPTRGNY